MDIGLIFGLVYVVIVIFAIIRSIHCDIKRRKQFEHQKLINILSKQ